MLLALPVSHAKMGGFERSNVTKNKALPSNMSSRKNPLPAINRALDTNLPLALVPQEAADDELMVLPP